MYSSSKLWVAGFTLLCYNLCLLDFQTKDNNISWDSFRISGKREFGIGSIGLLIILLVDD